VSFSLSSYAKVNLGLRILGKRSDGLHELCTVFQTVSLHDTLTFSPAAGLELSCDDPQIPVDGSNLIVRAAHLLGEIAGREVTGRIHLQKSIPSPGGLGGGSSNAVSAIVGLCRLNSIILSKPESFAGQISRLGADVPFFLYGGTALGTGRGDMISSEIEQADYPYMLIVTPDVAVPTAGAFRAFNAKPLTSVGAERILTVCRNEAEYLTLSRAALINDLESTVFAAFPEIERVKDTLIELGAVNAAMSGSGASVFAVFDNRETRQTALEALDSERAWRKFAVATVSRGEYQRDTQISEVVSASILNRS